MIDPNELIASLADGLNQYGSSMTLTRLPSTTVTLQGSVRGYVTTELVGGIQVGDRAAIIGVTEINAASWPAPPRAGDQMLIQGRTFRVISADPCTVAGVDIRYSLHIRGSA